MHGHRDMEIISYVINGALEHQDSTGNRYVVNAGEVQRMSAGSGIMHSEFNASKQQAVNFLQIWIMPKHKGTKPGYSQQKVVQNGKLTPLVSESGDNNTLSIDQDMTLSRLLLEQGDSIQLDANNRTGYLHLIKGQINAQDNTFTAGDAFAIEGNESILIKASEKVEALYFDLP